MRGSLLESEDAWQLESFGHGVRNTESLVEQVCHLLGSASAIHPASDGAPVRGEDTRLQICPTRFPPSLPTGGTAEEESHLRFTESCGGFRKRLRVPLRKPFRRLILLRIERYQARASCRGSSRTYGHLVRRPVGHIQVRGFQAHLAAMA